MFNKSMENLINHLQVNVKEKKIDGKLIASAISYLVDLGYEPYDKEKFPTLVNTESFNSTIGSTPENLAEALLWKLGKWPVYKTFVENYKNDDLEVSSTGGVVLSAFAKHLHDNDRPIYDQHAIRAIWAICELDEKEQALCKNLLVKKSGEWKDTGSGDDGSCYQLFVSWIKKICTENNLDHRDWDTLLMPLGQALKKSTRTKKTDKSDYQNFIDICNIKK